MADKFFRLADFFKRYASNLPEEVLKCAEGIGEYKWLKEESRTLQDVN